MSADSSISPEPAQPDLAPSRIVCVLVTIFIIALMSFLRLHTASSVILPIAYALPLVVALWMRDRLCLWVMAIAFCVLTLIKYFVVLPETGALDGRRILFCALILADTLVIAFVIDAVIRHRWALERQNALLHQQAEQLRSANQGLTLRDTQIGSQQRRFQTMLETLPFGVTICNADFTEMHINEAGEKLLGLPRGADATLPQWHSLWKLYREDGTEMPMVEYPLVRAVRDGEIFTPNEVALSLSDGRKLTILISAAPFRDDTGEIIGGICSYVDVTAMHELRQQLDLRRREAEEAVTRKARFLAAVSHDIRNPANAVNLLAELISRAAANPNGPLDVAEIAEMAGELRSSATALVNLVGDVLDMARYDSGKIENRPLEFVMQELLDELWPSLLVAANERKLSLQRVDPPEPMKLFADRQKLARVINNLVGNAIKFTEEGEVRLEYKCVEGGDLQLAVIDTGVGIPQEQLNNIFDEFFQLRNPERDRSKGSGLGLSICRRLVEAMKGRIDVKSTAGEGSTFIVYVPKCVQA